MKIAQYKGLNVALEVEEVTEEMINNALEEIARNSKRFETVERTKAQDKDIANINFEGFVDGVAFEGGKAENFDLTLGSHSFIDTFEEQIIGHEVNDEFDVNVTFPKEYHAENLKGKLAVFKVKLNSLKVEKVFEINDELAKANGFDNLEELKKALKVDIENFEKRQAEEKKYGIIAEKIVMSTEIELPEDKVEEKFNEQRDRIERELASKGATLDQYLPLVGKTMEEFEKELKEISSKIVKFSSIVEKIAEVENIKVEETEVKEEFEKIASMYNLSIEQLEKEIDIDRVKEQIFMKKIRDFLIINN